MTHIYIHVPFCKRKCPYCAFYSETDATPKTLDRFLDALLREVQLRPWPWEETSTLFLGGGTPTLLGPDRVHRLLSALPHSATWLPHAEVTMEANPGTLLLEQLPAYRQAGVNRLSVGVQSLSPAHLRFLGRIHTAKEALATLEGALKAGFRTSADLMYGLPHQRPGTFRQHAQHLASLGVKHLSCYLLSAEEQTPLHASVERGEVSLPSEATQARSVADMHAMFNQMGWSLYEVSSAAATPSEYCQQNLAYWRRRPYLGLGPAAHSFDGTRRQGNDPSVHQWLTALEANSLPPHFEETLTHQQHTLEILMLGLRTPEGLNPDDLKPHCSPRGTASLEAVARNYARLGYLQIETSRWTPTPKGLLWADALPVWITEVAEAMVVQVYR